MLHPLQGKLTVDDEHEDRIVVNLHRVVHDQQVSFLDAVARHTFASRPQVERGGPPVPDKVFRVVDALLDKRVGVAGSPPMPFGLGYSLTTWVTMPSLWTVSPSPNHTERTSGSSATSSSSPPWRTSRRRVNSSSMKYSPMASGFHFTASSITTRSPKMMPSPNIPRFVANTARLCRLFRIINLLIDVIVSLGRIACGDLPPPLIFPGGKPCRRTHPPPQAVVLFHLHTLSVFSGSVCKRSAKKADGGTRRDKTRRRERLNYILLVWRCGNTAGMFRYYLLLVVLLCEQSYVIKFGFGTGRASF